MNTQALELLRRKFMAERRVLCTGNPDRKYSIAQGVKKLYPNATFIHKSNGWDLTDPGCESAVKQLFKQHNLFINASYIAPGVQTRLLEWCSQTSKYCDVVNIGSTHEYDGGGDKDYQDSKKNLRDLSLSLNTYRFKTCHLILGHLSTSDDSSARQLSIDSVCKMIPWVFEQPFEIPILAIDNKKDPW